MSHDPRIFPFLRNSPAEEAEDVLAEEIIRSGKTAFADMRRRLTQLHAEAAKRAGFYANPDASLAELLEWWKIEGPELIDKAGAEDDAPLLAAFAAFSDLVLETYARSRVPGGDPTALVEIDEHGLRVSQNGKWLRCTAEGPLLDPKFAKLAANSTSPIRFALDSRSLATFMQYNPRASLQCGIVEDGDKKYLQLKWANSTVHLPLDEDIEQPEDLGLMRSFATVDAGTLADALAFVTPYANKRRDVDDLHNVSVRDGKAQATSVLCLAEYVDSKLAGVEFNIDRQSWKSLNSVLRRIAGEVIIETFDEAYLLRAPGLACRILRSRFAVPLLPTRATPLMNAWVNQAELFDVLLPLSAPDAGKISAQNRPASSSGSGQTEAPKAVQLKISRKDNKLHLARRYADPMSRGESQMEITIADWHREVDELDFSVSFDHLLLASATPTPQPIELTFSEGPDHRPVLLAQQEHDGVTKNIFLATFEETAADRLGG